MQEKEYKTLIKDIQNLLDNVCDDDRVKYHINPGVEIACKIAKKMIPPSFYGIIVTVNNQISHKGVVYHVYNYTSIISSNSRA